MGLMTDMGFEKANEKLERITGGAHEMGVPGGMDPLLPCPLWRFRSFRRS